MKINNFVPKMPRPSLRPDAERTEKGKTTLGEFDPLNDGKETHKNDPNKRPNGGVQNNENK